jgi:FeS assembly SUF system protein
MTGNELVQLAIATLRTIFDPEMPVNIYDLGLIYNVHADENGFVSIRMTLTAPNCPAVGSLPAEVESKVRAIPGVTGVNLQLVFDPPWTKSMMSEAARLELGLDDIIPISRFLR